MEPSWNHHVAQQMQRVFKLIAAEKRGDLKESDRLVLTRSLGPQALSELGGYLPYVILVVGWSYPYYPYC